MKPVRIIHGDCIEVMDEFAAAQERGGESMRECLKRAKSVVSEVHSTARTLEQARDDLKELRDEIDVLIDATEQDIKIRDRED